jgi:hypothetical protein
LALSPFRHPGVGEDQEAIAIEFMRADPKTFDPAELEQKFSKLKFGKPDDIRLTVKFNSSNNRHLKKAAPWLAQFEFRNPITGEAQQLGEATGCMGPSAVANYYVHLGVIPPRQIYMPPMTARIMLLGLTDDAPMRGQLEALPPDTVIAPTYNKAA